MLGYLSITATTSAIPVNNDNCISYHLSSGSPCAQLEASTVYNMMLSTETLWGQDG